MSSGFEGLKVVVDAFIGLYEKAKTHKLKADANVALAEALRELLLAPSNLGSPEAKIAIAKAAGLISADLILAENLLEKHKTATKASAAKKATFRQTPAKKVAPQPSAVHAMRKKEAVAKVATVFEVSNLSKKGKK